METHAVRRMNKRTVGAHGQSNGMHFTADAIRILVFVSPGKFQSAGGLGFDLNITLAKQRQIHQIQRRPVFPSAPHLRRHGNSVQRRLHGAGRNLKRLHKVGPAGQRQRNGHHQNFHIFPPFGKRSRRHQAFRRLCRALTGRLHLLPVAGAPGLQQLRFGGINRRHVFRRSNIRAHAKRMAKALPHQMHHFL